MIVQIRRGTTAQAAAHLGLEGSLFIDLTLKQLYIHDGVTAGGALVGGVSEARVQELIDNKIDALAVADITGLTEALEGKASLVDGKVPADQLPEVALTETQIQQLATEFGFTKDEDGKWKIDQGAVTP